MYKLGKAKPLIAFISCVSGDDETPIKLWISTIVEMNVDILIIMPPGTGEKEEDLISKDHFLCISLPTPKFFWPNGGLSNTIHAIFQRCINSLLLVKYLIQFKPDVCICSEPDAWLISVLFKKFFGCKIVAYIREIFDDRLIVFPQFIRLLMRIILRQLLTGLSRATDEIVHVSKERQHVYNYLDKPGDIVVHYPRKALFNKPAILITHRKEENKKVIIIHAGALRPTYGSDRLVSAISLAHQYYSRVKLLVVGGVSGNLENYDLIEELVKKDVVEIKPQVSHSEVIRLMYSSNIGIFFVVPDSITTIFAQPLKLYEYFAAGLPVIAADVPTARSVITKWKCGLLVDPLSVEKIASGIACLATNTKLRKELSKNALKAFQEEYFWENESIKVDRIINSCVTNRI
jgi:glycosyltransferase involved in cell wall biosynthesis